MTPIVCLDFDGVLHSYTSGWKGPREIPDSPVPGAIEWLFALVNDHRVQVYVHSSRSHQWGGRRAMRRWLVEEFHKFFWMKYGHNEAAQIGYARRPLSHGEIDQDFYEWAHLLVWAIKFPRHKPPAHITIDDRAYRFSGLFPPITTILAFEPWRWDGEDGEERVPDAMTIG